MPYRSTTELPDRVKSHLPAHAQEIYMKAFNHAWEEYAHREDREATAHRVAWSAVERIYEKAGECWVPK